MSRSMDGLDSGSGLQTISIAKKGSFYTRNFLLLTFTATFVVGNLLLQHSPQLIPLSYLFLTPCTLISMNIFYRKWARYEPWYFTNSLILLIILSGMYSGYFRAWLQADGYLKHSLAHDVMSKDVEIPACIISIPNKKSNFSRFIIKPIINSKIEQSHLKRIRVSANLKQLTGQGSAIEFKAGDCWVWNLRLKTTRGLRNKHGFDYEKWLYLQNISATAYLRALPQKLEFQNYPLLAFRANLAKDITQALPKKSHITGLILGLSLGMRDDISTEQWQILQNTGTSHLLAISGLHIGIAALFGFYLGKILYLLLFKFGVLKNSKRVLPVYLALTLGMLFAVFYAAMAGFSVSTQRACIMLLVASLCSFSSKKFKASSILCIALVTVLLFDPKAILSAGTWFSFLAVAILLLVLTHEKKLTRLKSTLIKTQKTKIKQAVKLQFFLILFLSVPVALVFAKVSILSPIVNFFLIPIFTFSVVPILLIALLLIKIVPEFSFTLINWQHGWLEVLWKLIEKCSEFPIAQIELQLNMNSTILFSVLLIPFILPKGIISRLYSLILLAPFLVGFSAKEIKPQELTITVFDVGQGLSVFLQTAGHQLLYDTGPAFRSGSSSAERVIKPWLQAENISSISALVISHSDNDHAGGYELIKDTFKPISIFAPNGDSIDNSLACEAGYSWNWDGVLFEFLYPFENTLSKNTNNYSCVLRVSLHEKSFLLTGDIEKEAESALLKEYANLQNNIVLVPHHGSKTSSTPHFVNSVGPDIAIIPAGFANRWRFPKDDILQRWQDVSQEVYVIADTGELNLHINAQGNVFTESWISKQCRYWHQDCQN